MTAVAPIMQVASPTSHIYVHTFPHYRETEKTEDIGME